jgi:signal peptidase I/conjugal transfer pilin signal peptidase TrbI
MGMKKSEDVMKILGCNEGDLLTVDAEKKFYCNGEYLVRAKDISLKGEPLQHFVFNGTIPKGVMFVMGQHKDSFDSRYFGFVDKSRILAKAYPIF